MIQKDWYIRYVRVFPGCTRSFNYSSITEERFRTEKAFDKAFNELVTDRTVSITGWTGCNSGGY